ncbi:MAG: DUF4145 domain-containing protein [Ignavibacteriales bacterium]|nr:DUF4145 domain-containing protein [Ignavibacteriales bacterium]
MFINLFEIDTPTGYKTVELHQGDLSNLDQEVDAIVVSAYIGGYSPTPGTLVGSLSQNCQISLKQFSKDPEIDLRGPLNVWISKELPKQKFKRIICIEITDLKTTETNIEKAVKNLFSLIALANSQDIQIETLAMPFIGTGNQGVAPEKILPKLMELSQRSLRNLHFLKKIIFYEIDAKKIKLLDKGFNTYLRRTKFESKSYTIKELKLSLKKEMIKSLINLDRGSKSSGSSLFDNVKILNEKLSRNRVKPYEVAHVGRVLLEDIVMDILGENKLKKDLAVKINELTQKNIASWVISYMHIIRTFGNLAVHSQAKAVVRPPAFDEKDFIIFLICLNRVLDFWVWFRSNRKEGLN